jgi:hypothetical protein
VARAALGETWDHWLERGHVLTVDQALRQTLTGDSARRGSAYAASARSCDGARPSGRAGIRREFDIHGRIAADPDEGLPSHATDPRASSRAGDGIQTPLPGDTLEANHTAIVEGDA